MRRLIDLREGSGGTDGHRLGHKLASIVGKENMGRACSEETEGMRTRGMCFWIDTPMSDAEITRRWPTGGRWQTPVIIWLH